MSKATREGYGEALVQLGAIHKEMVVLDADLAGATKTAMFKDAYPDRFIDCGIAEANMVGIAAGLASCGHVPYISSFAMFLAGRAYEQIRNSVGYPKMNIKLCATHAGISVGEDGATHQCNEDIALMRTIPGMTIINPADAIEAREAVKAVYDHKGPVYMRFGRLAIPEFNTEDYKFELGKGITLKEGTDITLIATGLEVYQALEASKLLEKDGISTRVINIHTIKPIDKDIIIKAAKETKQLFTIEEHSIVGGLGSAVSDVLTEYYPAKLKKIGINDTYCQSGPALELLHHYKLDAQGIYETVKEVLLHE